MQGALVMKILRNKWLVVLTTKIGSGGVNGPQVQRCPLCKGIKYQITLEFISLPPARFVSSHIKEKLSGLLAATERVITGGGAQCRSALTDW